MDTYKDLVRRREAAARHRHLCRANAQCRDCRQLVDTGGTRCRACAAKAAARKRERMAITGRTDVRLYDCPVCAVPVLRRLPKGAWRCVACKEKADAARQAEAAATRLARFALDPRTYTAACAHCSIEFTTPYQGTSYCSGTCSRRAQLRRQRAAHGPFFRSASSLRQFGLSRADWWAMLEACGRACTACRAPFTDSASVAVDHCHAGGQVRGLLCRSCNTALGLLKEDRRRLLGLLGYIDTYCGPALAAAA